MQRKKYKCIRDCYAYGRRWLVGEMVETDFEPNHHFELVSDDTPLVNAGKPVINANDSLNKDIETKESHSFSEMQRATSMPKGGMAYGLNNDLPNVVGKVS